MGKKVKEFKAGDFIFAKVKGYPAWPARVQGIKGKKYFVFFYGTREIGNLAPNMIFDYAENRDKFLTKVVKRKDFNDGVKQIEHDFTNNVPLEDVFGTDSCFEKSNADVSVGSANETMDQSTDDLQSPPAEEQSSEKSNKKAVEDSDEAPLVIDEGKKPKKVKTPKTPKTPRVVKKVAEEEKEEEVVSRSGRKIKPKRFIEEETEEHVIAGVTPVAKKRRAATPDKKVVPEKKTTPEKKGAEKKQAEKSETNYNTVNMKEIEDLKTPFNNEHPNNILLARLPSGKYIGIKLFQGRPTSFKSEEARLNWDKQSAKNSITLKLQLEKGEIKPDSVSTQIETTLQLTDEEKANLEKNKSNEETLERVQFLKVEMNLVEIDSKIKKCVSLEKADVEECLKLLEELKQLKIDRLMLLKHPACINTVKKLRCYVGNAPAWDLPPDHHQEFAARAALIRERAEEVYLSYKNLFTIPAGLKFSQYFTEQVAKFKECTSKLSNVDILQLVVEPKEMSKPEQIGKLDIKIKGKKQSPTKKKPVNQNHTTDTTSNDAGASEKNTSDHPESMDTSNVNDKEQSAKTDESDKSVTGTEKSLKTPEEHEIVNNADDKTKKSKEKNDKTEKSVENKNSEESEKTNDTSNTSKILTEKSNDEVKDKEKSTTSSSEKSKTSDSDKQKDTSNEVANQKSKEKSMDSTEKAKEPTEKKTNEKEKTKDAEKNSKNSNKTEKSKTVEKTKDSTNKTKDISEKANEKPSKDSSDKIDKNKDANEKSDKLKANDKSKDNTDKSKSSDNKTTKETDKTKEASGKIKTKDVSEKAKDSTDKSKDGSDKTKDSAEKSKETTGKAKDSTSKAKEVSEKAKESKSNEKKDKSNEDGIESEAKQEESDEPKAKRLRETRKTESKPDPPKTPTKKKAK